LFNQGYEIDGLYNNDEVIKVGSNNYSTKFESNLNGTLGLINI
jgi:hypothetical protein